MVIALDTPGLVCANLKRCQFLRLLKTEYAIYVLRDRQFLR
jgi:hypothetical protein